MAHTERPKAKRQRCCQLRETIVRTPGCYLADLLAAANDKGGAGACSNFSRFPYLAGSSATTPRAWFFNSTWGSRSSPQATGRGAAGAVLLCLTFTRSRCAWLPKSENCCKAPLPRIKTIRTSTKGCILMSIYRTFCAGMEVAKPSRGKQLDPRAWRNGGREQGRFCAGYRGGRRL